MNKKYIFLIIISLLIFLPKSYPSGHSSYSSETLTPSSIPPAGGCFSSCAGIQSNNFCFGLIIPETCNNFTANFNYFGMFDLIIK